MTYCLFAVFIISCSSSSSSFFVFLVFVCLAFEEYRERIHFLFFSPCPPFLFFFFSFLFFFLFSFYFPKSHFIQPLSVLCLILFLGGGGSLYPTYLSSHLPQILLHPGLISFDITGTGSHVGFNDG